MRVLLVAPDNPDLNTVSEIRSITSKHHATVLSGPVSRVSLYDACRNAHYTALHFATHSTPDLVQLSGGDTLDSEDVAQLARMAHADLVIFNSCGAAAHAAYVVRHGVSYAIAATRSIPDSKAWSFASAFFDALANGSWRNIVEAYVRADNGDGEYTLSIAPAVSLDRDDMLAELTARASNQIKINPLMVSLTLPLAALALALSLLTLLVLLFHVV